MCLDKGYSDSIPCNDMTELGAIIKTAMTEQSLSLRKLSELSGISSASISRILSNKQPANIHHLQVFSKQLNIPIEQLLNSVGIGVSEKMNTDSNIIMNMICDVLKSFDLELDEIINDIQKELKKYELYAKTSAGKDLILNNFVSKLNELNGAGAIINQLNALFELFRSKDIEPGAKAVIGSTLLYFIHMPDAIPDYAFPIGYLDDAIAVTLTVNRLSQEFHISL
ncbi:DUF1232 domain-containing protein [Lachnoclostridium phytofermentans]|uniref:Transcriptional regulator, XRE family n=1 Tax=Lachnoclostridium phytofermentans (strain ATCC 700394 / DSM 18823 / ISDg) TaxID=357809 RepID=A9KSE2_LACP7|nr:DUF1232 domain-containing protein [Lachnoclostridium phytofermentans]ABX42174.1 transcriptional regulator, XRE family [Lachnoclostridium phytofermentans ISDg]